MPRNTSPEKLAQIAFYGGRCHFVEHAGQVYDEARALAERSGGHYMDQFTYAELTCDRLARQQQHRAEHVRADDARASSGPGMDRRRRRHGRHQRDHRALRALSAPRLAGGGVADPRAPCSARLSRHRRCVADLCRFAHRRHRSAARGSELSSARWSTDSRSRCPTPSRWPRCACSRRCLGRKVGPSTGTNLVAMLALVQEMRDAGRHGAILPLALRCG